jgi:CMP-N,N'-diacetyllegionaminic acid synthase
MIDGKSVLALLTARGGSKGVSGKNVKPLAGKPLIAWSVEAARASHYVDRVLVTTDSDEIAAAVEAAGGEAPFRRPAELAGDLSKQEDAILHAMAWCERNDRAYDILLVLAPTTPLRDAAEIDAAIEMLARHPKARAIFSVRECDHSPLFANRLPEDGSMADFVPQELRFKNRQELPVYYRLSGSVALAHWDHFKAHGSFLTPATYAYVTDSRKGLDIDTMADFLLADIYMRDPSLR